MRAVATSIMRIGVVDLDVPRRPGCGLFGGRYGVEPQALRVLQALAPSPDPPGKTKRRSPLGRRLRLGGSLCCGSVFTLAAPVGGGFEADQNLAAGAEPARPEFLIPQFVEHGAADLMRGAKLVDGEGCGADAGWPDAR